MRLIKGLPEEENGGYKVSDNIEGGTIEKSQGENLKEIS